MTLGIPTIAQIIMFAVAFYILYVSFLKDSQ